MNRRHFMQKLAAFAALIAAGGHQSALAQATRPAALTVQFTLKPGGSGRYHKPYVAVWIETPGGEMVRTVALWRMQEDKGKKWLPDLRKWFRTASTPDTVSSATRGPGQYTVTWNGMNDRGQRVAPGEYLLMLESAREKGPYGRVRLPFKVGSSAMTAQATGTGDIAGVRAEYRPA
ncbi:DUF2271 domain-containing protein [Deinococcus lacus]|uniref:DUF2271 domain-containing protein n=1 Tax=Deinococcus lacus TaxID=392561 RepID=A0ABW1YFD1_9DEIO